MSRRAWRAAENTLFSTKGREEPLLSTKGREGPRRTPFLSAEGRGEDFLGSPRRIGVVGDENQARDGWILAAGVLHLTCFDSSSPNVNDR